jgi:hypothetical protein
MKPYTYDEIKRNDSLCFYCPKNKDYTYRSMHDCGLNTNGWYEGEHCLEAYEKYLKEIEEDNKRE